MIRIAVVGEIGSGKTYVSNLFGFPVFNADKEVAKIYKRNKVVFKKLKKKLPNFITTFPVKKDNISNAIKSNPKNLKVVTRIIHPIVRKNMKKFLKINSSKKAVVLDIPLYFENKLDKKKDVVIFISSKRNQINSALKKRGKSNLELLRKLSRLQNSLNMKKKKSHYVIKNDFRRDKLNKKVKILKKHIFIK